MSPPIDISNLPPDIMRIVLRMEENSMDEIRQISPSWNRIVVEYLEDRRYKLPIERVHLQSGVADEVSYGAQDDIIRRRNEDAKKLLHMHAIIPERCKNRVGFGKWLKAHETFQGATEVTCEPQKVTLDSSEYCKLDVKISIAFAACLAIAIVGWQICSFWPGLVCSDLLGIVVSFATMTLVFIAIFQRILSKAYERIFLRLNRLNRFFSSFSLINLLVFETFSDTGIIDDATSMLRGIHVEKIDFRVDRIDKYLQKRVAAMVRDCGIKSISIRAFECCQDSLPNFIAKVVKLGATVNIYEGENSNSEFDRAVPDCFHRTIEFWDNMKTDLLKEGISLKLTTYSDDYFNILQMGCYVRSRIACSKVDRQCHDDADWISPSWNRIAIQYLKESRNLLPLERVYLRSGHIDADYQAYAAQDFRMKWKIVDVSRRLHMYAIVPDRSKARIGLGKWLRTHQNFGGATEVTCAPQKIDLSKSEMLKGIVRFCILILAYFVAVAIAYYVPNLIFSDRHANAVSSLVTIISSVAFYVIMIYARWSGNALSNSLASTAYIIFPSRPSDVLKETYASNFLKKLVKLGATVNVYEAVNKKSEFYRDVPNYFHRSVEFWKKMQKDLEKDGIALSFSTIRDDGFKEIQCASYVRARLSCTPVDVECHDDLNPARGFYRSK